MDRIAVNRRTALKMFWDAGFETESAMIRAKDLLAAMPQTVRGYWFADTVAMVISMECNRERGNNGK